MNRHAATALVCLAAVVWLYSDVLSSLVRQWASDDNYSHGFFIIPLAIYCARERRELLRRSGMQVTLAQHGADALARLADAGPFDGVLMDCQMPVMDGYTATQRLRANPAWRGLPVIAMTASALAEDRQRAMASGMNAHITKPVDFEDYQAVIRSIDEFFLSVAQVPQP